MTMTWKVSPPIVQHVPADRLEWLALREHAVTASQAGALLGVHDYTTAYEIWAQKSGLLPPLAADDPVLIRGELLEDDALELLRRLHPDWQLTANIIGQNGLYLEDPAHRLGATPDAFCIDDRKIPAIIEIKTTDHSTFRTKWGGPDDPAPPLWIAVQANLTAYLAGARKAYIVCLVVGRTLDLHVMPFDLNLPVIKRLQLAAADFWKRVDRNEAPDPDFERDGRAIAALLPRDHGTEADLSGDNEFVAACAEKLRLMAAINELTTQMGRHEALIRHRMGTHALAVAGSFRVSNKLCQRKGYVVQPSEYRRLTVKGGDAREAME